jgi:hypothetical protein
MILHALSCRLDSELIQQKEFSTSHDDFECDSRVMPFKSEDTLAEWLRRRPAKALCSHAWVQIPQVSFFSSSSTRDSRHTSWVFTYPDSSRTLSIFNITRKFHLSCENSFFHFSCRALLFPSRRCYPSCLNWILIRCSVYPDPRLQTRSRYVIPSS